MDATGRPNLKSAQPAGASVARLRRLAAAGLALVLAGCERNAEGGLSIDPFGALSVTFLRDDADGEGPLPPDYGRAANWLCRPGRADPCASAPLIAVARAGGRYAASEPAADAPAGEPPVDCFFVYPTASLDPSGNADMKAGEGERRAARAMLAPFHGVCRLYAPVYRQVTLAVLEGALDGRAPPADRELAYSDVRAAWNSYLARDNQGRGVILIGHSQGAGLLSRLLVSEIEGGPVAQRIIAAYLPGGGLTDPAARAAGSGATSSATPLCTAERLTGCIVSFSAFRADAPPPDTTLFGRARPGEADPVCVNPARLDGSGGRLDPLWPVAQVSPLASADGEWEGLAEAEPGAELVATPDLFTARCIEEKGAAWLAVTSRADPRLAATGGDFSWEGRIRPEWGLHLAEMSLVMGNLVRLAQLQSQAWLTARDAEAATDPSAPDRP